MSNVKTGINILCKIVMKRKRLKNKVYETFKNVNKEHTCTRFFNTIELTTTAVAAVTAVTIHSSCIFYVFHLFGRKISLISINNKTQKNEEWLQYERNECLPIICEYGKYICGCKLFFSLNINRRKFFI